MVFKKREEKCGVLKTFCYVEIRQNMEDSFDYFFLTRKSTKSEMVTSFLWLRYYRG